MKLGASYDVHLQYRCSPFKRSKSAGGGGAGGSSGTGGGGGEGPGAWTLMGEEPQLGNTNWACPKHKVCAGQITSQNIFVRVCCCCLLYTSDAADE